MAVWGSRFPVMGAAIGANVLSEHLEAVVFWDVAEDPSHLSRQDLNLSGSIESDSQAGGVSIRKDSCCK